MTVETFLTVVQIKALSQEKDNLTQKVKDIDEQIRQLVAGLCPPGKCLLPHER
jgi:hypothetical protein